MPNAGADPAAWRQVAIDVLDQYLCGQHGARQLLPPKLKRYQARGVTHGWRLPSSSARPVILDIVIDGRFPYSAVRVALPEGPAPLEWPHMESDGILCVLPEQATISPRDPVGVTQCVLDDAMALIRECRDGSIVDDFRDEFLSYWTIATDKEVSPFVSLISPNAPSRDVVVWYGETVRVCADDRATLSGWLMRWGAKKPDNGFTMHRGILIWLSQPMVPSEYPRTAADIRFLAKNHASDALPLLEERAATSPKSLDIIIGIPTPHGVCFAAMMLSRPVYKEIERGFRSGNVPRTVLIDRYLGANKVTRSRVHRADHAWVHGRDRDARQTTLKEARVLVVGCGAIGSGVARLLAQSGVGHLTLIDPQRLDWPNVSRHVLGAPAWRENKAIMLAETLRRDFPHLTDIEGHQIAFGLAATSLIDELPTFDLVISSTGEWDVDALLNDLQRSRASIPPIVYAWVEAHAMAGHALLIPQDANSACLRCGFDDRGMLLLPVTNWPDDDRPLQEPACGAVFSPFGAVDVARVHALVAELALEALLKVNSSATHCTWIGYQSALEEAGGKWNPAWCDEKGNPGQGGNVVRFDWARSSHCPVCNRSLAA